MDGSSERNATQRNVLHHTATRFLGLTTLPTYLPT